MKTIRYKIGRICERIAITNFLGKIVEDEEKITCYVKKSRIENEAYICRIFCTKPREDQKKIVKAYGLDKPICYVIENMSFNSPVLITGEQDTEVIIKNCRFDLGADISVEGKCSIENTNIGIFSRGSIFAKDLTLNNIKFTVFDTPSKISLITDKLDIKNTKFNDPIVNIKIEANNKLNLNNSQIIVEEINCKSDIIQMDDTSTLGANNKIIIDSDNYNQLNIASKNICLNGEDIKNSIDRITLNKENIKLTLKRLELVDLLKNIKNKYESINLERLSKYEEEINNKTLSKIK